MQLRNIAFMLMFGSIAATGRGEVIATSAAAYCSARGFLGGTVERAISKCLHAGYQPYICARGVVCSPGIPFCSAAGFAGSTVDSAVYICEKSGFNPSLCGKDVYCH